MTATAQPISAAPPTEWSKAGLTVDAGPIQQSENLDELATALVQFQSAVTGAAKGGENPHFRSTFTRLEDAWKAARDALVANGLCVTQWPLSSKECVSVTTRIMHTSGQWMQATISIGLDTSGSKNVAQQYGSTITYAQRYAFLAALGLPPADDDGEGARAPKRAPKKKGVAVKAMKEWLALLQDAGSLDELRSTWELIAAAKSRFTPPQWTELGVLKDASKEQLQAEAELGGSGE